MATLTIVGIACGVVAVILILTALAVVVHHELDHRRHVEAQRIREQASNEAPHAPPREALADETASQGRAARAEVDVTTGQSPRLPARAAVHRGEASSPRPRRDHAEAGYGHADQGNVQPRRPRQNQDNHGSVRSARAPGQHDAW